MTRPPLDRAIVIVLDSLGIGELPDAGNYGDEGSDTLGHIAARFSLRLPALRRLGLGYLSHLGGEPRPATPAGAYGRMAELSPGKDSVTGHWELMSLVLEKPFPVFPGGFSPELIAEFERRIGRRTLGNTVASGTVIIEELGREHLQTGSPIVYTSADSVFQIAAHEDVIPIDELYRQCEIAYAMFVEGLGVGRIIARPFVGAPGAFKRTTNRRDFAIRPAAPTVLDKIAGAGLPVVGIGKIEDLFAGKGVTEALHTVSDDEGMERIEEALGTVRRGMIFANLVDFDAQYGHRNNAEGYALNLERFDARLARLLPRLGANDLLLLTADHGNDPTTSSTDHSREYVPVLAAGSRVRSGADIGTRDTFADLGATVAEALGVEGTGRGRSFLAHILD